MYKRQDNDSDGDDKLREGDNVEARFGGRDKWYAGKITNARSDGTFDILYEDGDTERRVKKRLIRKKKGGSKKKKKNSRNSGSDNDSDDDGWSRYRYYDINNFYYKSKR